MLLTISNFIKSTGIFKFSQPYILTSSGSRDCIFDRQKRFLQGLALLAELCRSLQFLHVSQTTSLPIFKKLSIKYCSMCKELNAYHHAQCCTKNPWSKYWDGTYTLMNTVNVLAENRHEAQTN